MPVVKYYCEKQFQDTPLPLENATCRASNTSVPKLNGSTPNANDPNHSLTEPFAKRSPQSLPQNGLTACNYSK